VRAELPGWAVPPLLALQFLTRVPVPALDRLTPAQAREGLARAAGWLPFVGGLIGAFTGLVFLAASAIWGPLVGALLALAAEARLTGAFHEDAVADFCDAFGGGRDAAEVRRILKDSRVGSYGALGLGLAVALRAAAMLGLPAELVLPAMIGAGAMGRLWVVALMAWLPPAPVEEGLAKDIGPPPAGVFPLGCATAAPWLLWVALAAPVALVASLLAGGAFLVWFARLLRRRIGGTTGDALGFSAYAGQLALLLACAARW